MTGKTAQRFPLILASLACAAILLSCAGNARLFRATTYRPTFRDFGYSELHTAMWRMAGSIHELARLSQDSETGVAQFSAVLMQIEEEARSLERDRSDVNHPYFETELAKFLKVVERANLAAQRAPIETTVVDEVWRACSECHAR